MDESFRGVSPRGNCGLGQSPTLIMGKPLTKAEAAAKCGTSEKTVERAVRCGRLRAHKIGGRLIVFDDDLEAFLERCANVPAPTGSRRR